MLIEYVPFAAVVPLATATGPVIFCPNADTVSFFRTRTLHPPSGVPLPACRTVPEIDADNPAADDVPHTARTVAAAASPAVARTAPLRLNRIAHPLSPPADLQ